MRVIKTDRGYIDMDHVLAVGEPYDYTQGLWGFDVTMAFLDKPKQMLYYPEQLGCPHIRPSDKWDKEVGPYKTMMEAMTKKRDEFVRLWKGEE